MFVRSCPRRVGRVVLLAFVFAVASPLAALTASRQPALSEDLSSDAPPVNFDLRDLRPPKASVSSLEAKKRGLAIQERAARSLVLRWDERLDLPHSLLAFDAPLTAPSSEDAVDIARRFVSDNYSLFRLSRPQIDDARVASREEEQGLFTRLVLQQRARGLEVFDSEMLFIIDGQGSLLSQSGCFTPDIERAAPEPTPSLSAEDAFRRAAGACGAQLLTPLSASSKTVEGIEKFVTSAHEPGSGLESQLVYYPLTRTDVRLAYRVWVYGFPNALDSYLILIDARTGELLRRDSLTYAFNVPRARVFTRENPTVSGDRAITELRGDPAASPQGWVASNRTEGNNVQVLLNPDLSGGATVAANSNGDFDFPLSLAPASSPLSFGSASATNLFYWVNIAHDRFYTLGFNESARNFQTSNLDRGGRGGDPVRAETLRGAAVDPSSTREMVRNNAFFSTRPEGTPPLLAMLLWQVYAGAQPVQIDSSYDAGVIIHEYTHGVTTRLTGTDSATGLRSLQGGGLGEGWSDFFAMSFLNDSPELSGSAYAAGSYLVQRERGIRSYPYSTDFTVNPLTFGDIQFNTEVHAQGTVWCTILWEVRQAMIARYGFDAGRAAAERLVISGLKMTPISPLFTDARDAILLADRTTNGGVNQELLWRAFARRGLGASASTSALTPSLGFRIAAAEAYDVPPQVTFGALAINDRPPAPAVQFETLPLVVADRDLLGQQSINVVATNLNTQALATITLQRTAPGRFAAAPRILPPGVDPGSGSGVSIHANPGEVISLTYGNAQNAAGSPETIEVRTTAGRRVEVFAEDFEQGLDSWQFPPNSDGSTNFWHLTKRRASSPTHSLYFAKRRGGDETSFTKQMSRGTAISPQFDTSTLLEPRLEFDYYFSGLAGASNVAADVMSVLCGNAGASADDPSLVITYDLRPSSSASFQRATIDLRFIENRRGVLSFVFTASGADVKRKQFEGFYVDGVRVTAVSTR